MQCVHNCHNPDPKEHVYFEQPVIQTAQMFVGEMGCWLVIGAFALYKWYFTRTKPADSPNGYFSGPTAEDPLLGNDEGYYEEPTTPLATPLLPNHPESRELSGWKVIYLALPACCDIAGTTLMNVGLLFVAASIYQMTRGALVLFVGLFSVLFLRRHLGLYKWFALFIVVAGVAIVGLAGAIAKDPKAVPSTLVAMHNEIRSQVNTGISVLRERPLDPQAVDELPVAVKTVIGVLLVAAAQIFTATQFVVEENIMEKYSLEPLKAVGWEGIWGFLVTVIVMVIMHFTYGQTPAGRGGFFDAKEGLWQMTHFRSIGISSILIMISIGSVEFCVRSEAMLTQSKWFQFLRTLSHTDRVGHFTLNHRHLPHPFHLDGVSRSQVGDLQVASGCWLCTPRLRDLPIQRYREPAIESVYG